MSAEYTTTPKKKYILDAELDEENLNDHEEKKMERGDEKFNKKDEEAGLQDDDEEDDDDDLDPLLLDGNEKAESKAHKKNKEESKEEKTKGPDVITFNIPTRALAILTIFLITTSHILLFNQCYTAIQKHKHSTKNITPITRWRVLKNTRLRSDELIHPHTLNEARTVAHLDPVTTPYVTVYNTSYHDRVHIISPKNGWANIRIRSKSNPKLYNEFLREMNETEILGSKNKKEHYSEGWCPLLDEGWAKSLTLFQYAPTKIVVAQQLWNAVQVLTLILWLCLHQTARRSSSSSSSTTTGYSRMCSILFGIGLLCLVPFSVYITSTGGHIFAIVSFITALIVETTGPNFVVYITDMKPRLFTPDVLDHVFLDHHHHHEEKMEKQQQKKKRRLLRQHKNETLTQTLHGICKMEFLGCVIYLLSDLFNHNTEHKQFPNYDGLYRFMDGMFHWVGSETEENDRMMESTVRFMYTLGWTDGAEIPLFVPLSYGSTTGSVVFTVVWSVLPFLYVVYFGILYAIAASSSSSFSTKDNKGMIDQWTSRWSTNIQKLLCAWGIFHFMFLTDVVEYRYGRGVRNPHGEMFHWSEKLAWRAAILLPIYQNVIVNQYWLSSPLMTRTRPLVGKIVHYMMLIWAVAFLLYQVLFVDVMGFGRWMMMMLGKGDVDDTDEVGNHVHLYGWRYVHEAGYHGSLLFMLFCFGFMTLGGTACRHIFVGRAVSTDERHVI